MLFRRPKKGGETDLAHSRLAEQPSNDLSSYDWDFADLKVSERQYGVHFFHHYTAKFIPQIPARLIRELSEPNDIVVDPFMGAGTTLVEAALLGRRSLGLDTNPLAVKIADAKTFRVKSENLNQIDRFLQWLMLQKQHELNRPDTGNAPILFKDSSLWFRKDVTERIANILNELESYYPDVRNFIEVGLSDLLKGMSNARMDSIIPTLPNQPVYVDRKHYYREVNNRTRHIPVYARLLSQVSAMRRAILEFNSQTDDNLTCTPSLADSRHLSAFVPACDLVVTSPPYWSAQNYEQLHMLSFKLFHLETEKGKELGRDRAKYLDDMKQVFEQISKILCGYFALVIGEDEEKRQHERLFDLAKNMGFAPLYTIPRKLSNQTSVAKQIKREFIYVFSI
jgi:DNA modification methylase